MAQVSGFPIGREVERRILQSLLSFAAGLSPCYSYILAPKSEVVLFSFCFFPRFSFSVEILESMS